MARIVGGQTRSVATTSSASTSPRVQQTAGCPSPLCCDTLQPRLQRLISETVVCSVRVRAGLIHGRIHVYCSDFWSTVCKTVRSMLSDRCLSVLTVCLSVTLVYCSQTVGWIKMKLGVQVGLGPGHIVVDRDAAPPPQRGRAPNFRPISVVATWLDGSRCHLVGR